jgi:hypothetical protein
MAFGAEELRVLRRALALALNPSSASAEDVQNCLRLAASVDEAAREGARLRAFLLADLARYRAALPGTATGYLALLDDALDAGHHPTLDDFAALRALRGNPAAAALLDRCGVPAQPAPRAAAATPTVPASRARLTALPGGRTASEEPAKRPAEKPAVPARSPGPERPGQPADKPGPSPRPKAPRPERRPIPTPGEVFPPKRKPGPPATPPQQLAAV